MGENRNGVRFPCHIYGIADAKEAYSAFRDELVRNYGDDVRLGNGKVLHYNYMWDDGSRLLMRCKECGGLMIRQSSEFHSFTDGPDGYYTDWIPVASEKEADLLNILLGGWEMENVPCRHLRRNNGEVFWKTGPDPVPRDPEELRESILKEYPEAGPELLKAMDSDERRG